MALNKSKHEDNRFRLELKKRNAETGKLTATVNLSREKQEELIDMFVKALCGRIDNIPDMTNEKSRNRYRENRKSVK